MRPTAWEIIGLQLINARLRVIISPHDLRNIPQREKDRDCLKLFKKLLQRAEAGLEISVTKSNHSDSLDKLIEQERVFRLLQPILPADVNASRTILRKLQQSCSQVLNRKIRKSGPELLDQFCKQLSFHLDQLRYAQITASPF